MRRAGSKRVPVWCFCPPSPTGQCYLPPTTVCDAARQGRSPESLVFRVSPGLDHCPCDWPLVSSPSQRLPILLSHHFLWRLEPIPLLKGTHPHHAERLPWAPGKLRYSCWAGHSSGLEVTPTPTSWGQGLDFSLDKVISHYTMLSPKFKWGWFLGGGIAVDFAFVLGTVVCCLNFLSLWACNLFKS